jgi:hypothetical protein
MAIINNSHQFIFIHVPKAAGTSLTNALRPYTNYCDLEIGGTEFGEQIQPAYRRRFGLAKHSTAMDIRHIVGTIKWSQMYSFSFVRNPFSRCLSTYYFLRKWQGLNADFAKKIKSFNSFDEYVLSDIWQESNGPDEIFRPQIHWLRAKPNNNQLLVDFVGHIETIETDFAIVLNSIGIAANKQKTLVLPQLNRSQQSSLSDIKNPLVIDKIINKYRIDFETFDYSLELSEH